MLLFVSGCVSQIPSLQQGLSETPPCCTSFSQMNYTKSLDGGDINFDINERSKVYEFEVGKSYFAAVEIRPNSTEFEITTYIVGNWIPTTHVFWPSIIFLDENHVPLRTLNSVTMRRGLNMHLIRGNIDWSANILIKPEEKYAVIYTSPRNVGHQILISNDKDDLGVRNKEFSTLGPSGDIRVRMR
jgi:maltose operon protein